MLRRGATTASRAVTQTRSLSQAVNRCCLTQRTAPIRTLKPWMGPARLGMRTAPPKRAQHSDAAAEAKKEYHMTFTCDPCGTRSSHRVSHQAYHGGTVLVQCPECKVRHLIADHLKIFSDAPVTVEDLLQQHKGQAIRKGRGQVIDGEVIEVMG